MTRETAVAAARKALGQGVTIRADSPEVLIGMAQKIAFIPWTRKQLEARQTRLWLPYRCTLCGGRVGVCPRRPVAELRCRDWQCCGPMEWDGTDPEPT